MVAETAALSVLGPRAQHLALLSVLFAAVLWLRNPSILLDAQFWAEDGWIWYPDAYSAGLASLFSPVTGYLQTLSRLVALLSQPFPLSWAPTLFAATAFAVQLAPAIFLVSDRMEAAWPSLRGRALFALLYLALPNSYETFVNLTNAQWYLAILAFLVVTGKSPTGWVGTVFDAGVLLLSGFSGPFCLALLPIVLLRLREGSSQAARWRAGLVLIPALVQGGFLLTSIGSRSLGPLGADPILLARIIATQIVGAGLIGSNAMAYLSTEPFWESAALPVAVTLLAAGAAAVALLRGPRLLKYAFLFAWLIFGAALLSPIVDATKPQWPLMATAVGAGNRYYQFPMLTMVAALLSLAADSRLSLRIFGSALLALMLVGIVGDWDEV